VSANGPFPPHDNVLDQIDIQQMYMTGDIVHGADREPTPAELLATARVWRELLIAMQAPEKTSTLDTKRKAMIRNK